MNLEQYEIEREARRPVYQKLIDILLSDPLGWEMMCSKVRGGDMLSMSSDVTEAPRPPEKDELFYLAVKIVRTFKRVSPTLLQEKLQCTYVKSVQLIDQLEAHGIISPKDGAKPRKVL